MSRANQSSASGEKLNTNAHHHLAAPQLFPEFRFLCTEPRQGFWLRGIHFCDQSSRYAPNYFASNINLTSASQLHLDSMARTPGQQEVKKLGAGKAGRVRDCITDLINFWTSFRQHVHTLRSAGLDFCCLSSNLGLQIGYQNSIRNRFVVIESLSVCGHQLQKRMRHRRHSDF